MSPTITSAVCQACGACCSLEIDGQLIACGHLRVQAGRYTCAIYDQRPAVCRDYTCVRGGRLVDHPAIAGRVRIALELTA